MDSIALSWQQKKILTEYNKWEKIEDQLKEYIMTEIKEATGRSRVVLERILNMILAIDKAQDEQIERVLNKALIIAHINRLSNQILMPYDVNTKRYKPRVSKQMAFDFPIEIGIQEFKRRDVS